MPVTQKKPTKRLHGISSHEDMTYAANLRPLLAATFKWFAQTAETTAPTDTDGVTVQEIIDVITGCDPPTADVVAVLAQGLAVRLRIEPSDVLLLRFLVLYYRKTLSPYISAGDVWSDVISHIDETTGSNSDLKQPSRRLAKEILLVAGDTDDNPPADQPNHLHSNILRDQIEATHGPVRSPRGHQTDAVVDFVDVIHEIIWEGIVAATGKRVSKKKRQSTKRQTPLSSPAVEAQTPTARQATIAEEPFGVPHRKTVSESAIDKKPAIQNRSTPAPPAASKAVPTAAPKAVSTAAPKAVSTAAPKAAPPAASKAVSTAAPKAFSTAAPKAAPPAAVSKNKQQSVINFRLLFEELQTGPCVSADKQLVKKPEISQMESVGTIETVDPIDRLFSNSATGN